MVEHMARQITPDEIRGADLGGSIRGYDRKQTEQFLADVAEAHAQVIAQRDALARQAEALRSERTDREAQADHEVGVLKARLEKSQRRALELEEELDRLRDTRSKEDEDSHELREELARARSAIAEQRMELAEHEEVVVRLRTREKALSERLAMMEAEARAQAEDLTVQTTAVEERALLALARVEQAAETIEREARGQVETILTKARERAEEILRAAEESTADHDVTPRPSDADIFRLHEPPELRNPATSADQARERLDRPEFDAGAPPDLSFDLRPTSAEPRPDPGAGADEDAGFRLSDYQDRGT